MLIFVMCSKGVSIAANDSCSKSILPYYMMELGERQKKKVCGFRTVHLQVNLMPDGKIMS
jgi:hypothetical protein